MEGILIPTVWLFLNKRVLLVRAVIKIDKCRIQIELKII